MLNFNYILGAYIGFSQYHEYCKLNKLYFPVLWYVMSVVTQAHKETPNTLTSKKKMDTKKADLSLEVSVIIKHNVTL